MKIAVVVPGRFDAFDLAKALIDKSEEVVIYTNYPRWAVKRFGIPAGVIRSFWLQGLLSRVMWRLKEEFDLPYPDSWLNRMFGKWAAKNIIKCRWDVVHTWSGFSEEVLKILENSATIKILMRGSSHVRTQSRLLEEEEKRCGVNIEKPSRWIIAREEREYKLAGYIRVISSFARASFIAEGVAEEKLLLIPSGVTIKDFRPSRQIIEERRKRILSGKPLRALYVGALSFRKGLQDLRTIVDGLKTGKFEFRLVGPASKDSAKKRLKSENNAEYMVKQPQHKLPQQYAWADIFIFPTIEDGFAVVLAQAQASGLPIITTTNCAGPDLIIEWKTGWALPIRSPYAFIEKLLWCGSHRKELAKMAEDIYEDYKPRDWSDVAKNFIAVCEKLPERQR